MSRLPGGYQARQQRGDAPLIASQHIQDLEMAVASLNADAPITADQPESNSDIVSQFASSLPDASLRTVPLGAPPRPFINNGEVVYLPAVQQWVPLLQMPTSEEITQENTRRRACNIMSTMPWRDYTTVKLINEIGLSSDTRNWPGITLDQHTSTGLAPGMLALSTRRRQALQNRASNSYEYRVDIYLGWLLWHQLTASDALDATVARSVLTEYLAMPATTRIDVTCASAITDLLWAMQDATTVEDVRAFQLAVMHYRQCWQTTRATNRTLTATAIAAASTAAYMPMMSQWSNLMQQKTALQAVTMILTGQPQTTRARILVQLARSANVLVSLCGELSNCEEVQDSLAAATDARERRERSLAAQRARQQPRNVPISAINTVEDEDEEVTPTPTPPPRQPSPAPVARGPRFRAVHIRE